MLQRKAERIGWEFELERANEAEREVDPNLKSFEPKNENLDILSEYTESEAARSWISPEKLRGEAERAWNEKEVEPRRDCQNLGKWGRFGD